MIGKRAKKQQQELHVTDADGLRDEQEEKARFRGWIMEQMEQMEMDDLFLLYTIVGDIEDYKTFFKVLKKIK